MEVRTFYEGQLRYEIADLFNGGYLPSFNKVTNEDLKNIIKENANLKLVTADGSISYDRELVKYALGDLGTKIVRVMELFDEVKSLDYLWYKFFSEGIEKKQVKVMQRREEEFKITEAVIRCFNDNFLKDISIVKTPVSKLVYDKVIADFPDVEVRLKEWSGLDDPSGLIFMLRDKQLFNFNYPDDEIFDEWSKLIVIYHSIVSKTREENYQVLESDYLLEVTEDKPDYEIFIANKIQVEGYSGYKTFYKTGACGLVYFDYTYEDDVTCPLAHLLDQSLFSSLTNQRYDAEHDDTGDISLLEYDIRGKDIPSELANIKEELKNIDNLAIARIKVGTIPYSMYQSEVLR